MRSAAFWTIIALAFVLAIRTDPVYMMWRVPCDWTAYVFSLQLIAYAFAGLAVFPNEA